MRRIIIFVSNNDGANRPIYFGQAEVFFRFFKVRVSVVFTNKRSQAKVSTMYFGIDSV